MKVVFRTIGCGAALLLAACGSEAPTPAPQPSSLAAEEALPLMGPKVRILAFGDSLFAGYNLADGEGYPDVLQNVLRPTRSRCRGDRRGRLG